MVTRSMPQSNHTYFWWRSKTDCRKAQCLDSAKCCWLHWTQSCRHTFHSPLPLLLDCLFLVSLQLWWAWQVLEKLFLHLMGWFSLSFWSLLSIPGSSTNLRVAWHGAVAPQQQCQLQMPLPQNCSTHTTAVFAPRFCAAGPWPAQGNQNSLKGSFLILLICSVSFYSRISSFTQLMTQGKESCAGTAEGWPAKPGRGGHEGRISSWGQGKEASSSSKCQHHHQILLPVKPQFQTKTQNIHLKVTFHTSSPTALLPARQDHITAAPCVGSAVFTNCSWGLQLSQGTAASSLLLTHFMTQGFVSLPACGFYPTLKFGSKPLYVHRNKKQKPGLAGTSWTAISQHFCLPLH